MALVGIESRVAAEETAWMDAAACKGLTHLYFAASGERPEHRRPREAKAEMICARCTVAAECKQFARVHHEYGYWGGESEEARHHAGYRLNAPIGVGQVRRVG